jgi:alkylhydroperoxidase family enzyme
MTSPAAAAQSAGSPERTGNQRDTVASLLKSSEVPKATLERRYGPLLKLVQTLIGVVPKCDGYLEIWPPAFRTYNIMVPNFLNLPFSIFGVSGTPVDVVGLGLYVASRVAECPYCSAHTCSFSLRRGATPEKMAQALVGGSAFTPQELATITVARALARIPSELLPAERAEMEKVFKLEQAEWIVAGICMMGFLNKFMDACGVELESSTAAETASTLGPDWKSGKAGRDLDANAAPGRPPPADSLGTKLRIIPLIPWALRTDKRWQKGVPASWPHVGEYLRERTGHDFPVLSRLKHKRLIQSIGSMIRENVDEKTTVVGLELKVLTGMVFASVIQDNALADEIRVMGKRHKLDASRLDDVAHFATTAGSEPVTDDSRERAALWLARAASPSPSTVDANVIEICQEGGLAPAALVEVLSWLSVLQMLHRLASYYRA